MAILSSLLGVSEPTGVWITIIKAFENVTGRYVLAIIFLTVVIKLITEIISIAQKVNSQKMNEIMAKSQPELEKVREKYANKPEILRQKENEIQKKYYGNKGYIGGCLINLVTIAISFAIFWTLFPALNSMAAYKTTSNYENLKYTYANCLNVVDKYYEQGAASEEEKNAMFADYKNLVFQIGKNEEGKKEIALVHKAEEGEIVVLHKTEYLTDFSETEQKTNEEGKEETVVIISNNQYINNLINRYVIEAEKEGENKPETPDEGGEAAPEAIMIKPFADEGDGEEIPVTVEYIGDKIVGYETKENEEGQPEQVPILLADSIKFSSNIRVIEEYDLTQDKFLWIENIWITDSPANKSIQSFATLNGQVPGGFEKGEEAIYNAFMPGLKDARNKTNGYFILTILCIAVPMLTMFLTKLYNNRKFAKKMKKEGKNAVKPAPAVGMAKWLPIVLPIVLGVFTLLYNSMFSIYLVTGQVVSLIISYPQALLVDLISDKLKGKKKEEITSSKNDVDYSRKF